MKIEKLEFKWTPVASISDNLQENICAHMLKINELIDADLASSELILEVSRANFKCAKLLQELINELSEKGIIA